MRGLTWNATLSRGMSFSGLLDRQQSRALQSGASLKQGHNILHPRLRGLSYAVPYSRQEIGAMAAPSKTMVLDATTHGLLRRLVFQAPRGRKHLMASQARS